MPTAARRRATSRSRSPPRRPRSCPSTRGDATSDWHGTLTEDGGDQYSFTFGGGHLSVEAAASNHGTNLRTVIVPTNGPIAQDGQSCATWTSQSTQQLQQGAALQVRADDTGRIRTLTVTKNIIFYAVWGFHFHTWDTDRSQPFDQFGEFDLSRTFRRLDLGAPLPWSMCARVLDHDLEFKAWPAGEPEPAWGDPRYGGRAPIPDGWDVAGRGRLVRRPRPAGWVGHARRPGGRHVRLAATDGTPDGTSGRRSDRHTIVGAARLQRSRTGGRRRAGPLTVRWSEAPGHRT